MATRLDMTVSSEETDAHGDHERLPLLWLCVTVAVLSPVTSCSLSPVMRHANTEMAVLSGNPLLSDGCGLVDLV